MSGDLDKMLAEWPMPPPSDLDRDDAAERVTAAIASRGTAGPELDALLGAPLPARDSEKNLAAGAQPSSGRASFTSSAGVENKMSKDRGRDRTSFQELAKLAGTPAPQPVTPSLTPAPGTGVVRAEEGGSDDSGIVDLKMVAALDPHAQERAKATPLAAQGLFDDDAPASAAAAAANAPPPSVSAVAQSSAPAPIAAATPSAAPPASGSAVASLAPPKKEEKKKGGGGLVLLFGGLLAAGAIAAGAFFVVKSGVLTGGKGSVAATTVATPAEVGPGAKATATAAATVAAADTGSSGVDMDTLPGTAGTTGGRTMPRINAGNGTKATAAASVAAAPTATGSVDPKLVANNIPNSNGGGGGDLTAAMKLAAGGGSANPAGTDTATGPQYAAGTVPQKPSQGQVQGAINAVLPEARKCLAEGDPISRATIVFQSDGTVKSVSVSGFAAGKPAEACVQTALKKAKISPFAEASYTFPVTVRAQ